MRVLPQVVLLPQVMLLRQMVLGDTWWLVLKVTWRGENLAEGKGRRILDGGILLGYMLFGRDENMSGDIDRYELLVMVLVVGLMQLKLVLQVEVGAVALQVHRAWQQMFATLMIESCPFCGSS